MNKSKLTNTPIPPTPAPIPSAPPELHDSDKECSDEEDFDLLLGFNAESARNQLYTLPNSITLAIEPDQQRDMFIEVGVNLSSENPFKQISKQFLEDHLSTDSYEMKVLKEKLKEIEDDPLLLLGFVPHLSDETRDTFIIYLDEITCKEASEIIRRLEAFERRKIRKSIIKYARPYQSMGSEISVDTYVSARRSNTINVELQSVYPMRHSNATFKHRFSDDRRDGYAELLPEKRNDFQNIYRKLIDRSIQSGIRKITEEQQTDPTFPTNAWSQYLYELEETAAKVEAETETIASDDKKETELPMMYSRRKKSKEETPVVEVKPEEPTISKQTEDLLQILEFNQIDMYHNDYRQIGKEEVVKYQTPYLEEVCCFADVSKCKGRYITAVDWHPEISGVCVAAYGFSLKSKIINDKEEIDEVKRTIIESNPILIWSFDDPLHPQLELKSLREISAISFCPYDGNVIIGGTVNGQIIIWDIKNRLEKSERNVILTPDQQKHRNEIQDYLKWSKIDDSNKIVMPAAISSIDKSHKDAITSIKWMSRNYQCTSKGLLKEDRQHSTEYRHFVTVSLDGNISFWDLEWQPSPEEAAKIVIPESRNTLPAELRAELSQYKSIDKIFMPHFSIILNLPITNFTFNEGEFFYEPLTKLTKFNLQNRVPFKAVAVRKESFNPKMIIGSSIGELFSCYWEGNDFSQGAILDPKTMQQDQFAYVHDGPIIDVQRNPFNTSAFISIGGRVLALWHDEYTEPILIRQRKSLLKRVSWSLDRSSVFFLICENGTFEIWDLNNRIDVPSLSDSLGGNILTEIAQHKLKLEKRLIAVADFNTNLRIFVVPNAFVNQQPNEVEAFKKFIEDEIQRKKDQAQWRNEWYEANKDIVEAKKEVEDIEKLEEERREKNTRDIEERRAQIADAENKRLAKKNARKMNFDLTERLDKKWSDQNYKRLLKTMMERKKVDKELLESQTKILKDRMAYNEEKKVAVRQNLSKIEDDLSAIRARLIPTEEYRETREELISEKVEKLLAKPLDYKAIESEALKMISAQPQMQPLTLPDVLKRCKSNRDILNQTVGGGKSTRFDKIRSHRNEFKTNSHNSLIHPPRPRSVTFSAELKDD